MSLRSLSLDGRSLAVAIAAALGVGPRPVWALEIPGLPGVVVHDSQEVLQEHSRRTDDGGIVFSQVGGSEVRFILRTDHPEITNPGDGAFHPADPEVVRRALADLPNELVASVRAEIFLLPYPREGQLGSSAHDRAIYITPGVHRYTEEEVHFLVTHEFGHVFQRTVLPIEDVEGWEEYRVIRGIEDSSIYHDRASHAFRPREVFAEDFRALFGSALARGDGGVENRGLTPPDDVPGLRGWFERTLQASVPHLALRVAPNPARPGETLRLRRVDPGRATRSESLGQLGGMGDPRSIRAHLVDVLGRASMPLEVRADGDGGLLLVPRVPFSPGAYWIRLETADGASHAALRVIR